MRNVLRCADALALGVALETSRRNDRRLGAGHGLLRLDALKADTQITSEARAVDVVLVATTRGVEMNQVAHGSTLRVFACVAVGILGNFRF